MRFTRAGIVSQIRTMLSFMSLALATATEAWSSKQLELHKLLQSLRFSTLLFRRVAAFFPANLGFSAMIVTSYTHRALVQ